MNSLPFEASHNCQSNTEKRDCQASTLTLPLSSQYEEIKNNTGSFVFLQVCGAFQFIPRSQQHVSQSGPTLCRAEPIPRLFFSAVDS